jgi:hypothetical protein
MKIEITELDGKFEKVSDRDNYPEPGVYLVSESDGWWHLAFVAAGVNSMLLSSNKEIALQILQIKQDTPAPAPADKPLNHEGEPVILSINDLHRVVESFTNLADKTRKS